MKTLFNFRSYFQKRQVTMSNKRQLSIKCVGFLANGKIYKSRYHWLLAFAKIKVKELAKKASLSNFFKSALVRQLLLGAKLEFLKAMGYSWERSIKIASIKNELRAMKKGYSQTCSNFIYLPYSLRKRF